MAKYLVTLSVTLSNTYEIEAEPEPGVDEREFEVHLKNDLEADEEFPRRVHIVENMLLRNTAPTGGRWELDDWDIDDVALSDH